jgi:flagellar biosynthesis regulator FlbT
MYLDSENMETHHNHFVTFSSELFAATGNAEIRGAIAAAVNHIGVGEFYRALSALRAALPVEKRLLDGLPE